MNFDEYLDEAVKKTGLTFKERIKQVIFQDWQKDPRRGPKLKGMTYPEEMNTTGRHEIDKLTDEVHAYALKHHIAIPFEAYEMYGDDQFDKNR